MRKVVVAALIAAILQTFVASAASAEPIRRFYKGDTSQGHRITMRTAVMANGQVRFAELDLTFEGTCEDSTSFRFGYGVQWGGRSGPVLTDGVGVDIDERLGEWALHIHGQIGRRHGAGTVQLIYATLTEDEQAQLCTTGEITWDVDRAPLRHDDRNTEASNVTRVVRNGEIIYTLVPGG
jgi:hypothetical protein